jgi:fimbrial isopeptide formation D2 family protein
VLGLALLLAPNLMAVPAYAEDPGELTIDKGVEGWTDGHVVQPGDTFVYTITITCTNVGSGGCTNAQLTDPLPTGLSLNPDASAIAIQPAGAGTASANGNDVTVDFTQPLTDPPGSHGIQPATDITIKIPVKVDDDISPDLDGQNLTNTASVDADNADKKSDSFVVVPNVPANLKASTDKSFDPASSVANPGNKTTMKLTGGNDSNVPVDEIVLSDPTNPPNSPATSTSHCRREPSRSRSTATRAVTGSTERRVRRRRNSRPA